ncbi:alanine racemase [Gordonia crocea]|uniref:Amino acid deaminase n=1 Tax=Gordonia crocea TaxID=589162 RepID=A0A7I9V140_9ACTN|nr:alanine racemase [Gordonia crocea]GED99174.1 amino acid deaminase [Gordonia crocea]
MTFPQMRIALPQLASNVATMAKWCSANGVELWPHIKTTMCRPIVERQLAAGAAAVTVATADQAAVAASWGCRRILVANQMVNPIALQRIWRLDAEVMILVDSERGVVLAESAAREAGVITDVLIDIGRRGGRTGVRDGRAASTLAQRIRASRALRLVGVSAYEAVGPEATSREASALAVVDDHLRRAADVFVELVTMFETERPVFTAGGSTFPDRVVAAAAPVRAVPGAVVTLRSGCYIVHDHGLYQRVSPIAGLVPAVTVRAEVLSTPESGVVVVGAGKRDVPHDADLPTVLGAFDARATQRKRCRGTVAALYDHHAVVRLAEGNWPSGIWWTWGSRTPVGRLTAGRWWRSSTPTGGSSTSGRPTSSGPRAQSTEMRAQSAEMRAQSAEMRAQSAVSAGCRPRGGSGADPDRSASGSCCT